MGRILALLAGVVLALALAGAAPAVPDPSPQPMLVEDGGGGCSGYDGDCILAPQNGTDVLEGDGTWGGGYDYYADGGSQCGYAGAHRSRHAPIGKLWTMFFQVYYCWNGNRVTRLSAIGPWGRNDIGSPWNKLYGVDWSTPTSPTGLGPGGTYAYMFTQMSFHTCFALKPLCAPTISPWIEIVLYSTGYAVCYSDVDYIGGCRGVKYR
jgi:hypothetical protein